MPSLTLEILVVRVATLLEDFAPELTSSEGRVQLLANLGWLLPPAATDLNMSAIGLTDVVSKFNDLRFMTEAERQDEVLLVSRVAALASAIAKLTEAVGTFARALPASLPGSYITATRIDQLFVRRLLDLLIVRYVERHNAILTRTLQLAGIFEITPQGENAAEFKSQCTLRTVHLEAISAILDPGRRWATDVYQWATPNFKTADVLNNIAGVLQLFGEQRMVPTILSRQAEEAITGAPAPLADSDPMPLVPVALKASVSTGVDVGVSLFGLRRSSASASDGGIGASPFLFGGSELTYTLPFSHDQWQVSLIADAAGILSGLLLLLRPGSAQIRHQLFNPGGSQAAPARLGIGWSFKRLGPTPARILALPAGIGLDITEASLVVGGAVAGSSVEGFGELDVKGGRLVVGAGEDGFLASLIPGGQVALNFDVGVSYSPSHGLRFRGSGGLEIDFNVNKQIGPVRLGSGHLGLKGSGGDAVLETSIQVSGKLGPVEATLDRLGFVTRLGFEPGNVGPVGVSLGFKAPTSVGISIDAGSVTGGGFLFFDSPNNRYGGALELKVYSVNVKAFGVIETKLPNGQSGFSFAIVISAEFNPIQLGLGFTLNGVGGIIGINRRIDQDALAKGVRTGALERLLFPHDVVHDAPQIIHDLQAVLPATEGRYVFGPLAKIGWGTPTIIEAELGIILELPGPRLALLGEVSALLPKKDKGIITLNLSVAGLLDFPKKYFAIDASLHDSKVGSYPISGDMAMRLSWGDNPTFALAVGGFNPAFQPPAGFPALRRVAVDLGVSGNPSLTLQGYFALTSNTAQFGALAELNASGSGVTLYARVQFDALIVFSPFSFEVDISAQVSVKFHGHGITAHLKGMLSGPSPWQVRGEVCVSILWWDACLGFNKTFGSGQKVELPSLDPWLGTNVVSGSKEVLGLQEALQDARNWTPEPPPAVFAVVSLTESSASQLFDPLGVAVVKQTVCPFNLKLQRFGSAKATGTPTFVLQQASFDGSVVTGREFKKEPFAKAQFVELTAAQKLSAPAFEPFDGAIRLPANDNKTRSGSMALTDIAYKTKVLGAPDFEEHPLPVAHQEGMRRRSAAGLFGLRQSAAQAYLDPTARVRFTVGPEEFVIGNKTTLTTQGGLLTVSSNKLEAILALSSHLVTNPEDRDVLQVYPKSELGGR